MRTVITLGLLMLAIAGPAGAAPPPDAGTYHGNLDRGGMFVVPGLTATAAASAHPDAAFRGQVNGHVYAQPLYWRAAGAAHGLIAVVTESNEVDALDAETGAVVWRTSLGQPVRGGSLPCGNINPLGITGTPIIAADGIMYLDAMVARPEGPQHLIYALSMTDGKIEAGYPIDVAAALKPLGMGFDPHVQNQRSALGIVGGKLYVPYGGLWGDCGDYHGWVVGVDLATSKLFGAWYTRAAMGGIWAQGGIAYDGKSMFVATGNTGHTERWEDGEAIIRIPPDLTHADRKRDYFTPKAWLKLDNDDLDLGGTGPVPLDVPQGAGTEPLILALGKDGHAYLMNRDDLGGEGTALVDGKVSRTKIITAPAVYPLEGGVDVAFYGTCDAGPGIATISIHAGSPPTMANAWCASVSGAGSPIVTTTDGSGDPIVWVVGAEGDDRLHGLSGVTGAAVYASDELSGLHHFQTVLAAEKRLYVGADDRVYAFAFDLK